MSGSEPPSPLRYGRIVYAWISDRNGNAKLRPAIVLTPTEEISADRAIVVAAITTTFTDPPPSYCVQLPWHPSAAVMTRLRQRSAAVVNWLAAISAADIVGYGGDVSRRVMITIERKLKELPDT